MANIPDAKKRRILRAARRLLIRRGFSEIILDDVARSAGVAKGTLFLHYENKEELVSAVFADMVDQLGSILDQLRNSGRKGRPLLKETIRTILVHFDKNHDFVSRFCVGRRTQKELIGKLSENMKRLAAVLRLCGGDGVLDCSDMELAAGALFGLCRSTIFHRILTGRNPPLAGRVREVEKIFLYGAAGKKR